MAFKKGQSGNPNGRPKGSVDEKKAYIRDWVMSIIGTNGKRLEQNFQRLSRKEQWRVITQLLPYVLPRQHEAILDASVDANMQVTTPEPITIHFVASKEDLEAIQKEIPDIEESKGDLNKKE
ncbi:hypothetical protein SAMN04488494_1017 [Xylanibacter ruminicola]|jgi:hypothetical protein|uniref:DUF5681 domain-containing protein n=1 Tax=Xylanibacter ruminicola TaxID=839 RepID=A0A1M7EAV9_XYLRU|nr:DUF5681 domain-containing protein [Xylanibacter ruminicola]SFC15574.1 hypothetical protein SAMN04488493_103322 [Xylanibacter ruminicola]SHL88902.1 hypothetical protein SAMN04488494_1017 [Xylanibacter ruminicola]